MNELNIPTLLTENFDLGKVVRDGKVAVLYSPGFGAGWSTWESGGDQNLIFDPMLVKYVEEGNFTKLHEYAEMRYPDVYKGGLSDLTIAWLPVGTLFRINEYDGSESIETLGDTGWIKA